MNRIRFPISKRLAFGLVAALAGGAVAGWVASAGDQARAPNRPAPDRPLASFPPAPSPPPPSDASAAESEGFAGSVGTPPAAIADPATGPSAAGKMTVPETPAPIAAEPMEDAAKAQIPTPGEPVPLWLRNAVPSAWSGGQPAIAVVIDDLGIDRKRSGQVIGLPGPLTLAWLPYARDVGRQTAAARAAGHELLLHMPMEPQGAQDPGPGAMLTGLPDDELRRRLDAGFSAFTGYVGLNNHMGSRFTEDRRAMDVVLAELRRRGLLFLDSRTTAQSVGMEMARGVALPAVGRDVFIDHEMSSTSVRTALARIEAIARRQGWAIGIGHPHDVTIGALSEWLPGLEARGFKLVPVSAIVKARRAGG